MAQIDLTFPIPEEKLLARFRPTFAKLSHGQPATILALPQTGRTSLLRSIIGNQTLLTKLGMNSKSTAIIHLDIDKTTETYESFLSEILINISDILDIKQSTILQILLSKDPYLLGKQFEQAVQTLTKTQSLLLVITLNHKAISFSQEIDLFLTKLAKEDLVNPIKALWSIDTAFYRQFTPGSSSSLLRQNIFLFPTFDEEETVHSLKRRAELKGRKLPTLIQKNALILTGGIASLFHPLTNIDYSSKQTEEVRQLLFQDPAVIKALNEIKRESLIVPDLAAKLAGKAALEIIDSFSQEASPHNGISLLANPTAQEINLLTAFQNKVNQPLSREEIAEILWGKNWQNKYSDWAIDKAISRLRKQIKSPEYRIITVKNLGYQLYKL